MFMITVSFGTTACPLLFKTEDSAKAVWQKVTVPPMLGVASGSSLEQMRGAPITIPTPVTVEDDFGRQIHLTGTNFAGAIFEDLEVSKEGQIEQALHQARTQASAQQRGQADPKLMAMNRMAGPSMISPFGPNGRM